MPSRAGAVSTSVAEGTRVLALGATEHGGDLIWQRVRIANGTEGRIAAELLTSDWGPARRALHRSRPQAAHLPP